VEELTGDLPESTRRKARYRIVPESKCTEWTAAAYNLES
jgi:hypothetical protein